MDKIQLIVHKSSKEIFSVHPMVKMEKVENEVHPRSGHPKPQIRMEKIFHHSIKNREKERIMVKEAN
jgi:hypothetical protein